MENAPLDINLDLSKVVTTTPLIADGTQTKVRLKNISQAYRDGNAIIKWEFILSGPAPTTEGGEVQAGFPIFVNFDMSHDFLIQKMARFVDGLLGTGDTNNNKNKPVRPTFNAKLVEQLIGLESVARIVVNRSKKTDYVGNDIASLTYPQDLVA